MSRIEKLTAKEEEIMSVLWQLGHAFVKDIVAELDKELHYNTVSTIVRNLEEKGFVAHKTFGKTHQYYAIVDREVYSGEVLKQNSQRFFDGSYKNMVSYFAKENKISQTDLEDILELIKHQK